MVSRGQAAPLAKRLAVPALFSSMGTSVFADAVTGTAFSWWIYDSTGSAWALTVLAIVRTVFYAGGAPAGGLLADHYDRRDVMWVSSLTQACLAVTMGLLGWVGLLRAEAVLAGAALLALARGLFTPSVDAVIPQLTRKENLTRVNSGFQAIQAVAGVGGPLVGGLVVAAAGLHWALTLVGGAYLLSALAAIRLPGTRVPGGEIRPPAVTSVTHRLVDIARYLKGESLVTLLMGFTVLLNLLVLPVFIVLPVITRDVLGLTAAHYGGLQAVLPAGVLVGTLLTATVRVGGRKAPLALGAIAWTGLAYALLAYARTYLTALACVGAMGLGMAVASVVGRVILQELVPPDRLGRVFGLMSGLTAAVQPLGYTLAGALLAGPGPAVTVLLFGVLTATAACVAFLTPGARRI